MLQITNHLVLHFIRPQWFFALLPLTAVAILLWFNSGKKNQWRPVIDKHLIDELLVTPDEKQFLHWVYFLFLGWLIAIFALAGPSFRYLPQMLYQNTNALVLAMDLSENMRERDLKPNRMLRALYKTEDILRMHKDGRIGMVAFSQEAYTVAPLTQDHATITAMLNELSPDIMPVQGENLTAAMKKSAQLLTQGQAKFGSILLITSSLPAPEDIQTAKNIHAHGMTISVLYAGKQNEDTASLRKLVNVGGGMYAAFTNDNSDIKNLLTGMAIHQENFTKQTKTETKRWEDAGRYFIVLLLPLVLLAFRRGVVGELL